MTRYEDNSDLIVKSIARSEMNREQVDLSSVYMDLLPDHERNALMGQYGYLVEK